MTLVQQVLNRFDKIRHGLPARVLKPRMSALECWKSRYSQTWDLKMSRALVEREGDMVGPNALYLRQPFRIEEYTILDALLRHLIERKGEVKVLDVACGSGLACFFIAASLCSAVNIAERANSTSLARPDSSTGPVGPGSTSATNSPFKSSTRACIKSSACWAATWLR